MVRIGVEVYGGPILATFTDRDLSIAGRVTVRTKHGHETRLLKFDNALMRLPNLAIHMNREVNDKGLTLNKQTELPLLFAESENGIEADKQFLAYIAQALKIEAQDILTFELNVFDTQKGSFWGANQEFIANSQLDNLASCHAAITALLATKNQDATSICALFDHEEVGSESTTGASGSFLSDTSIALPPAQDWMKKRDCAHWRKVSLSAPTWHMPTTPTTLLPTSLATMYWLTRALSSKPMQTSAIQPMQIQRHASLRYANALEYLISSMRTELTWAVALLSALSWHPA